jgi:hypothetical protein
MIFFVFWLQLYFEKVPKAEEDEMNN